MERERVARAQAGDREAFGELVRAHMERVYRVAFGMMGNHADADEAAQGAFLKAFKSLPRFKGDSSFFTWMYRITINHCLDALRDRGRSVLFSEMGSEESDYVEGLPDPDRTEDTVDRRQAGEEAWRMLERLSPPLRAAVWAVHVDDLSPREAARHLGCSEATIYWRMFKARRLLREWSRDPREGSS